MCDFANVIEVYKEYEICKLGNGFTVFYEGDEVYFQTLEEARNFISEIIE